MPMRTYVTVGRPIGRPPATVVGCGMRPEAAATHSRHWNPTGACTMHSGHIGRPHRVQVM